MFILGIDPGLAIVGWGAVEYNNNKFRTLGYGAITTPAGIDVEQRLLLIYDGLDKIIKKYKPDQMAREELFFNTNQKTAIAVAEARGVIMLCGIQNKIPLYEYTPLQVKQAVVGYGRAEKKQVIAMTNIILDLKESPKLDDTSDALAIAVCHGHTSGSTLKNYYNQKKKKLL